VAKHIGASNRFLAFCSAGEGMLQRSKGKENKSAIKVKKNG